jgi:acetyltransferase-like isoleucine patch superfamily enzyme
VKITSDSATVFLGREAFVGFNTEFDVSQSVRIGDKVLIAPGCFITDHSHRRQAGQYIADQGCDVAPVVLGDDVWLGAGVVVLPGVTIGTGAIVAAGAVVNRSVEPMAIVAGVPARAIGTRTG